MKDATADQGFEALIDASAEIGELLGRYIQVHNLVFKRSLRHIIPIPGFFRPILFQQHFESLRFLEREMERVRYSIAQSSLVSTEFAESLLAYSSALQETMVQLRQMCGNLFQKADGSLDYAKEEYKRDFRDYHESVVRYQHLGSRINAYFGR